MNQSKNVNANLDSRQLERLLAAKLRELLASIPWLQGWTVSMPPWRESMWDVEATLPLPAGGWACLVVECKKDLRPIQFDVLASRRQAEAPTGKATVPVLALPYVSERMADVVWSHGWSWYDLAGNCRIDIPGLLRIERTGNPAPYKAPRPGANLGSPESARVLRALLAPQHAGRVWTQRELQTECRPPVSLGLVNKLVRHLREQAFTEEVAEGGFRLRDPERALGAWAAAYRFERQSRRGYFTLLKGSKLVEALAMLEARAGGRASYASFSAAEFQAPHVRQPRTWLYLAPEAEDVFRGSIDAKPVESGENLTVLFPEDEGVFYLQDRAPGRLAATNPVQTYVDLLHSGGRGEEAAEALLEQRLRPAWSAGVPR